MEIYQAHTHRNKTHAGHNFVTYQIDKYQTNVLTKIYNTMNEYLILEFEKKSPGQSVSKRLSHYCYGLKYHVKII